MDTGIKTNKEAAETTAIWSITPKGIILGEKIQAALGSSVLFVSEKLGPAFQKRNEICIFKILSSEIKRQFYQYKNHVFIFSTGIVVRIIGPLLESKTTDPAVVVMDDNANFAISLVSGHLGGANLLAEKIGKFMNATPVITTATDTNKVPAIDLIAQKAGLYIETPQNIKHVNMAFLTGNTISVYDPLKILDGMLPDACISAQMETLTDMFDVVCTHKIRSVSRETLVLRPPVLCVGIGCNRNTSFEDIQGFMQSVLKKESLSAHSVCRFATTEVKKDEKGLIALSDQMKIPLDFYNKNELNSVTTIKTPSPMAQKHLGVNSVCEAAAILSAGNGELIVTKHKNKDVTIAVAMIK